MLVCTLWKYKHKTASQLIYYKPFSDWYPLTAESWFAGLFKYVWSLSRHQALKA